MAEIELINVHKSWGNFNAVVDFNLIIKDQEFLVLLGPSGCGKTTTHLIEILNFPILCDWSGSIPPLTTCSSEAVPCSGWEFETESWGASAFN